jgi:predicted small secreted protein
MTTTRTAGNHSMNPYRTTVSALIATFNIIAIALLLSGCNTFEGIGRDIEAAGDKIEDAASTNKKY